MDESRETRIERHRIDRFGDPISFARQSKEYCKRYDDSSLYEEMKKAAQLEDSDARALAVSLIEDIRREQSVSDELRKRFETMENSLEKVNKMLIKDSEATYQGDK